MTTMPSLVRLTLRTLLLLSVCCAVADEKPSLIRENPYETAFPSGGRLRMDLCSSGVEIRGTEENKLHISYDSKNGDDTKVKVKLNISGNEGKDRKSTRLNSSHVKTSYAVFCLKKKQCSHGTIQG